MCFVSGSDQWQQRAATTMSEPQQQAATGVSWSSLGGANLQQQQQQQTSQQQQQQWSQPQQQQAPGNWQSEQRAAQQQASWQQHQVCDCYNGPRVTTLQNLSFPLAFATAPSLFPRDFAGRNHVVRRAATDGGAMATGARRGVLHVTGGVAELAAARPAVAATTQLFGNSVAAATEFAAAAATARPGSEMRQSCPTHVC